MTRKRDFISEILDKKDRLPKTHRMRLVAERTRSLIDTKMYILDKVKDEVIQNELFRYFPIAYVACIEHYYRLLVKDLIDHGDPYVQNVSKLENIPITLNDIVAMQGKKVTVGDFVAHILRFNNMPDIEKNMSQIIGEDYVEKLKKNMKFVIIEFKDLTTEEYEPKWYSRLNKLFELRHIYCHELSKGPQIDSLTLLHIENSVLLFLLASERFIKSLLGNDKT